MVVYLLCYLAAVLFTRAQYYLPPGTALFSAALVLFQREKRRNDGRVNLLVSLSLFFVDGEGISCLKLSRSQDPWELQTFAALFLAYGAFCLTFPFSGGREQDSWRVRKGCPAGIRAERLFVAVADFTALPAATFLVEICVLGLMSFLVRHMPHAYFYFHVGGLHYLTVSYVLMPSFVLLYVNVMHHGSTVTNLGLLAAVVVSLLIPMLCMPRFQLLFVVLMAVFTWFNFRWEPIPVPLVELGLVCLLGAYDILSMVRGHSISYLNGILEMERNFPIFVSQPYIYIANNCDSVNCLIRELSSHSFGLKMPFPFFALTGLRFPRPELVNLPIYVTETELTTITLIYDAWYDLGILGVVLFMALLGFIAARFEKKLRSVHGLVFYMFYTQLAIYLMLSFFMTWFLSPATWAYSGETALAF